jgi:fructosamine-3-kinase
MDTQARFLSHLRERFTAFFGRQVDIHATTDVTGGDINRCQRLETSAGTFFLKSNAGLFGLDLFEKEARGLVTLANAGEMRIPRPLFDGRFHQQVYLVTEWLEKGERGEGYWSAFGSALARLHRHSSPTFGFEHDNYIGRLHQSNRPHSKWTDFLAQERILPLTQKALERGLLSKEDMDRAESLCGRLSSILPEEPPALLHGDLWSGNCMCLEDGSPALFDPAVYFGHRETDLAMTLLFGGFDDSFYGAYEEVFPLSPGWRDRVGVFQLYPLLVHLLLFGGAYRAQVSGLLSDWK